MKQITSDIRVEVRCGGVIEFAGSLDRFLELSDGVSDEEMAILRELAMGDLYEIDAGKAGVLTVTRISQ